MVKAKPLTVLLSGYYGFDNGGDEALLEALLDEWRALRPDTRFIVLSGNPTRTAARHRVQSIGRADLKRLWAALGEADVFVSGGGSLLQDATSSRTVPYYTGLMALARRRRVPVVVYSQGLGPLRKPFLRRMAGRALQKADLVLLRDEASAGEARALGADREDIVVTADPVFARWSVDGIGGRDGFAGPGGVAGAADVPPAPVEDPVGPLVGVSLRPLQGDASGAATEKFVANFARELVPFLERHGGRVLPLPLFPDEDEPVLRLLAERLEPGRIAPWPAPAPARELALDQWLDLLRSVDVGVTMRLHGLIFAATAGTPFVALADDPKVDAHGAELDLPRQVCPAAAVGAADDRFQAALEAAWKDGEDIRGALRRRVPVLAQRARHAVELAVDVAERKSPRRVTRSKGPRQSARERVMVLDVAFDPVTMAGAVERAAQIIDGPSSADGAARPAHIVTANPEIVMAARRDGAVKTVLAEADLVVADGIGVVGAARLLGTPVPERVPGVELTESLLERAAASGWRVYLLGGGPGVAEQAAKNIRRRRPDTRIVGFRDGYFSKEEEDAVAAEVARARPDIVFVAMGAPRQELFIAAHRAAWRDIPVAIGVGGSIDVLAGKVARAPRLWQKLGLEWLYRVVRQPSRIGRALVLPRFAGLVLLRALRRNLL